MRLLLLPCHEVLERDELQLFLELGHHVFSPGSFVSPQNRGDHLLRPTIAGFKNDPEEEAAYHALGLAGVDQKERISAEFARRFDAVIVHHVPEWITKNWAAFEAANIPVIWRTIGQSIAKQETLLRPLWATGRLKIVRYSPAEERIPSYLGADWMIRFAKDPEEWTGWVGTEPTVLHVGQDVLLRRKACSFDFCEKVTRPFRRTLMGQGSEAVPWGVGKVPFEALRSALRECRVLFSTGTHPASYTLGFIEAWMTGIPVVSIGNIHGNSPDIPGHRMFEVPELLNGTNGFASDDPYELQELIADLLENHGRAKAMGAAGRADAIRLFGKEHVKDQWRQFLGGL